MVMGDPNAAAQRWATGLTGAGDKIKAGVQSVTTSPGALAAAQADVWVANVTASKDKFKRNSAALSISDWQTATIEKGIPRIQQGAQAAQGKMANFLSQLFPYIEQARKNLRPRGNLEQNIARSGDFARSMSQFKYNR